MSTKSYEVKFALLEETAQKISREQTLLDEQIQELQRQQRALSGEKDCGVPEIADALGRQAIRLAQCSLDAKTLSSFLEMVGETTKRYELDALHELGGVDKNEFLPKLVADGKLTSGILGEVVSGFDNEQNKKDLVKRYGKETAGKLGKYAKVADGFGNGIGMASDLLGCVQVDEKGNLSIDGEKLLGVGFDSAVGFVGDKGEEALETLLTSKVGSATAGLAAGAIVGWLTDMVGFAKDNFTNKEYSTERKWGQTIVEGIVDVVPIGLGVLATAGVAALMPVAAPAVLVAAVGGLAAFGIKKGLDWIANEVTSNKKGFVKNVADGVVDWFSNLVGGNATPSPGYA